MTTSTPDRAQAASGTAASDVTVPPVPAPRARAGGSVPIRVPQATTDAPLPGPAEAATTVEERAADARLARVHLRGGALTLARATLEGMAGAGTLDREAMADLAEVRWRSGDLEGAAEAARAHEAAGGTEPLASLIIVEDLAETEQTEEAAELAAAVSARIGGAVDMLFAAEPRSATWAAADDGWMPVDPADPGRWGLLVGGREVAAPDADTWHLAPLAATRAEEEEALPAGRGGVTQPGGAATTTAAVTGGQLAGAELESVDRSLEAGDPGAAAQRLGVLLRLDPALAPIILSAADRAAAAIPPGSRDEPAIQLVRGDAYRVLGRDTEAAAAYEAAHQALGDGPESKEPT